MSDCCCGSPLGPSAPSGSIPFFGNAFFGSGSDGALVASSGTTVLTRDTYFSSITLTGTAKIETRNFRLFCSGKISLKGAGVEIFPGVGNGGNAVSLTAGAAGAAVAVPRTQLGISTPGGIGASGNNSTGTAGSSAALTTIAAAWGGGGGQGGGTTNNVGVVSIGPGSAVTVTSKLAPPQAWGLPLYFDSSGLLQAAAGAGGRGGNSGQTSGTAGTTSGGGGGGGAGGGLLYVACAELETDGTTPSGALNARGGNGGNGGNATTNGSNNGVGGGSGGGAGGGGLALLLVGKRTGPTVTKLVNANSGQGGNGGNGAGTSGGSLGGSSGSSTESGPVLAINLAANVVQFADRFAGSAVVTPSGATAGAVAAAVVDHGVDF